MFKSQWSGIQFPEKVKPVRVVVETRQVDYTNTFKRDFRTIVTMSKGTEIVKEMVVGADEVDEVIFGASFGYYTRADWERDHGKTWDAP